MAEQDPTRTIAAEQLVFSVPLLLACLAGLYSERAGVFDTGLEGKMLAGTFAGASAAAVTGSARLGLGAAVATPVFFALVHGFASITHRGDQIVFGVISFIAAALHHHSRPGLVPAGRAPALSEDSRFDRCAQRRSSAQRAGARAGLSDHSLLVYVASLMVPSTWLVLFSTRFGLGLRAVGENPAAVDYLVFR
ncbi:hypothetical protein [Mesorhizobium sp. M1163]|uniref:ABC transporter permease subunit n=1 Tax=Mesorhizobium sp. M1163 TaxID=2957065 RepID=UPI00333E04BA